MTSIMPVRDVRKRWRVPWYACLLAVLVPLLALPVIFIMSYGSFRAWELESAIGRSLPPGSTENQVDSWSKAQGLSPTRIGPPDPLAPILVQGYDDEGKPHPPGTTSMIVGGFYNPFWGADHVTVVFYFDEAGRLILAKVVHAWDIGP